MTDRERHKLMVLIRLAVCRAEMDGGGDKEKVLSIFTDQLCRCPHLRKAVALQAIDAVNSQGEPKR